MKATNFDRYLKEQLADPAFARRFKQAGQAWDVALQIAAPGCHRRNWRYGSRLRSSRFAVWSLRTMRATP